MLEIFLFYTITMASSTEHRAGREKHTQRKKEGSRFVQGNKSVFILQCNYNENLDNSDAAPWQMSAQQPSQQPRIVFMSSWVCVLKELHQMSDSDGNILQLFLVCQFVSVSVVTARAAAICGVRPEIDTFIFLQHRDLTFLESLTVTVTRADVTFSSYHSYDCVV